MKRLKIKGIEKDFQIDPGKIYSINVENRNYYRKILMSILDEDDEMIFYSENNELVDFSNKSLLITDVFNMDPNSKKILNSLYKRIEESIITDKEKEKIADINVDIINILNKISMELNLDTEYLENIDISKILNLYKFNFKDSNDDLVSKIITYIKANMEIMNLSFVVTINILPLIEENEFNMFQKELEMLGITLININYVEKFNKKSVEYLTIDSDLCEF